MGVLLYCCTSHTSQRGDHSSTCLAICIAHFDHSLGYNQNCSLRTKLQRPIAQCDFDTNETFIQELSNEQFLCTLSPCRDEQERKHGWLHVKNVNQHSTKDQRNGDNKVSPSPIVPQSKRTHHKLLSTHHALIQTPLWTSDFTSAARPDIEYHEQNSLYARPIHLL